MGKRRDCAMMATLDTLIMLFLSLSLAGASLTLPDTKACCRSAGLSTQCIDLLCDSSHPPSGIKTFEAARNCSEDLPIAARCLADGRNHSKCCNSEAEDRDQSACFDLCEGSAAQSLNRSKWEQWDTYRSYMTCLSFNVGSIYQCFRQGYLKNPAPPRRIKAVVESPTAVRISWEKPEKFPEIAQKYFVFYGVRDGNEERGQMKTFLTTDMEKTVEGLRPDTSYEAYVVSSSQDGAHLSLKSNKTEFVTAGVPPSVRPYKALVHGSEGYFSTLVCKISVPGREKRKLTVIWQHRKSGETQFRTLNYSGNEKYSLVSYLTEESKHSAPVKTYVSTLTIRHIHANDFGLYSCVAKSKFGIAAGEIRLSRRDSVSIPSGPPNITQCCSDAGMSPQCLHGCTGTPEGKPANAARFWSRPACVLEIPKLLSCSLDGVDQGACCLRRRVPFGCLSFCDGGMSLKDISVMQMFRCLSHTSNILACQEESKVALPEVPSNIHVVGSGLGGSSAPLTLQWDSAERATLYHVYHRQTGETAWNRKTVAGTEASLSDLGSGRQEVVLVSANSVGHSAASRTLQWPDSRRRDAPPLDETADRLRPGAGRLQKYVAHSLE